MQRLNINITLSPQQQKDREQLILTLQKDQQVLAFLEHYHLPLSIVAQRVQMFADWLERLEPCDRCVGLHTCVQTKTGYVLDLEPEPFFNLELKPCRYEQAYLSKTAHRKNYSVFETSETFLEADIRTITESNQDLAYLNSIKEIPQWLTTNPTKGYYFYGLPGSGKTYLALAIANHFAKQDKKCAVVHVPTLAAKYSSSYSDYEQKEVLLNHLRKAFLVVFDDIGAESYTSWFRDEILFPILNDRMEAHKLTLFTSNHNVEALQNHFRYNQKADDESVKSGRMMERILTLAKPLNIAGINRRK